MSEYYTQVVRVEKVEKHPNADRLDICTVLGEYNVVTQRGAFKEGDLAAYFSVDALLPVSHPEFKFLDKGKPLHRLRAARLRGVFSMGLLVPAPAGVKEGDNVAELFGVTKYETPSETFERVGTHTVVRDSRKSETVTFDRAVYTAAFVLTIVGAALAIALRQPLLGLVVAVTMAFAPRYLVNWNRKAQKRPNIPVYDIEGLRRFGGSVFEPNEVLYVTEKIHGMNASFVHTGRKFHAKSRTMFRPKVENDRWWTIAKRYDLERKLKAHPNMVLFGEVYGKGVQDLDYDLDDIDFAAFDVMDLNTRKFLNVSEFLDFCYAIGVPTVPALHVGPWNEEIRSLSEGKSTIASHTREGIVIRPMYERHAHFLGRVILKLAGEGYLTRKEKEAA